MISSDRAKRVDALIKSINSSEKDSDTVLMRMSDKPLDVPTISTGSIVLDKALGGGFGKGRIIEIYGAESSGKTSVALTAVGNVQKEGGVVVYLDVEHALDPRYARNLGVDVDELIIAQPSTAEKTLDLVNNLVTSNDIDMIVVDSVASMVPQDELEGEAGDATIGLLARLMSKEIRKIIKPASQNGTTVLFINQTRDKIGGFSRFGTPQVTPGGKALKYYASQRVKVSPGEKITDGGSKGNVIGTVMKFKVEKNKIAPPMATGQTVLTYSSGINLPAEFVEVGESLGVIARPTSRSWVEVETGEKFAGSKAEALEAIQNDHELFERLKVAVYNSYNNDIDGGGVDNDERDGEEQE